MKTYLGITWWLTLATLISFNLQPATIFAQGTAFTYQGRLQNNGNPASGTYNLTFSLFKTNTSGVPIAGPATNNAVGVTNGLFTVLIDFGPGVFTGATNWLQIAVATNGVNTFTTLAPRQQLTPTPYAIYAENASGLSGTLSASQLTSLGNTSGGSGNFFVGPSGNSTTSGSYNVADGVAALANNAIGSDNTANGYGALDSNTSGSDNTADGFIALHSNTSGSDNIALGSYAGFNITTGSHNIEIGNQGFSTDNNTIRIGSGQSQTFIAGVINGNGSGLTNLNVSAAQLTSLGNTNGGSGNFFVGSAGNATTSGGFNTANGAGALFSNTDGSGNTANGYAALVGNTSGNFNTANGAQALVSATSGSGNTANGYSALYNNTSGSYNIALGYQAGLNLTTGSSNIDIGNLGNSTDTNTIRLGSGQSKTFIAGVINGDGSGLTNLNTAQFANSILTNGETGLTLGGTFTGNGSGLTNLMNVSAAQLTSIGNDNGGWNFFVGPSGSSTTSGWGNTANGMWALNNNTSGWGNTANGLEALYYNTTGSSNTANGVQALFHNTSGWCNTANGAQALCHDTIGWGNTADGFGALFNVTSGYDNIALGWGAGDYITTGNNNIDIGNHGLSTDNNIIRIGISQTATYLVGTVYANGVALTSDRNAKENFTAVNPRDVLAKVASLPMSEWNYRTDSKDVQHIGPMAQDFQAAFGLNGTDDKHISVVDEGGVALAAIQGLNQKLDEKDAEIQTLNQQNDSLAERLNKLEATVKQLAANK